MSKKNIDIMPVELDIVLTILRKRFTLDTRVWVFGSRARCTAKKTSDLDLAIDMGGIPIPLSLRAILSEDFDESALPFKVDIVDWNTTESRFKQIIEKERVLLMWHSQ